jgi:hypothetical protein
MVSRRSATAFVLAAAVASGCTTDGKQLSPTAVPSGCDIWPEGPAAVTHPAASDPAPEYVAMLREQFEVALPSKLSPDAATADDSHVLKVLSVRHAPNGQTYTEFLAVSIGTTIVRVAQRPTPTTPKATPQLSVMVRCRP